MPKKYFTLLVVTYKYLIIKKNIKKKKQHRQISLSGHYYS